MFKAFQTVKGTLAKAPVPKLVPKNSSRSLVSIPAAAPGGGALEQRVIPSPAGGTYLDNTAQLATGYTKRNGLLVPAAFESNQGNQDKKKEKKEKKEDKHQGGGHSNPIHDLYYMLGICAAGVGGYKALQGYEEEPEYPGDRKLYDHQPTATGIKVQAVDEQFRDIIARSEKGELVTLVLYGVPGGRKRDYARDLLSMSELSDGTYQTEVVINGHSPQAVRRGLIALASSLFPKKKIQTEKEASGLLKSEAPKRGWKLIVSCATTDTMDGNQFPMEENLRKQQKLTKNHKRFLIVTTGDEDVLDRIRNRDGDVVVIDFSNALTTQDLLNSEFYKEKLKSSKDGTLSVENLVNLCNKNYALAELATLYLMQNPTESIDNYVDSVKTIAETFDGLDNIVCFEKAIMQKTFQHLEAENPYIRELMTLIAPRRKEQIGVTSEELARNLTQFVKKHNGKIEDPDAVILHAVNALEKYGFVKIRPKGTVAARENRDDDRVGSHGLAIYPLTTKLQMKWLHEQVDTEQKKKTKRGEVRGRVGGWLGL